MALLRHSYPCSSLWSIDAENAEKFLVLDFWVVCQKSIVGLSFLWSSLLVHSLTVQSKLGQVHSLVHSACTVPARHADRFSTQLFGKKV